MKQGRICIYWEIKPDHIVAAVEMDQDAKRLPLVMRRHIVTRLREVLIPAKHDRRAAEGVGPYGENAGGVSLAPTGEQIGVPGEQIGVPGEQIGVPGEQIGVPGEQIGVPGDIVPQAEV